MNIVLFPTLITVVVIEYGTFKDNNFIDCHYVYSPQIVTTSDLNVGITYTSVTFI
jgi:hypothetical protein